MGQIATFGASRPSSQHHPQNMERALHTWHGKRMDRILQDKPLLMPCMISLTFKATTKSKLKSAKKGRRQLPIVWRMLQCSCRGMSCSTSTILEILRNVLSIQIMMNL